MKYESREILNAPGKRKATECIENNQYKENRRSEAPMKFQSAHYVCKYKIVFKRTIHCNYN